jgi:hypothetical protein
VVHVHHLLDRRSYCLTLGDGVVHNYSDDLAGCSSGPPEVVLRRSLLDDDRDLLQLSDASDLAMATKLFVPSLGSRLSFGAEQFTFCPGLAGVALAVRFRLFNSPFAFAEVLIDARIGDDRLVFDASNREHDADVLVEMEWCAFTRYCADPLSLLGDFFGGSLRLDGNLAVLSALDGARALGSNAVAVGEGVPKDVERIVEWASEWSGLRLRRHVMRFRGLAR